MDSQGRCEACRNTALSGGVGSCAEGARSPGRSRTVFPHSGLLLLVPLPSLSGLLKWPVEPPFGIGVKAEKGRQWTQTGKVQLTLPFGKACFLFLLSSFLVNSNCQLDTTLELPGKRVLGTRSGWLARRGLSWLLTDVKRPSQLLALPFHSLGGGLEQSKSRESCENRQAKMNPRVYSLSALNWACCFIHSWIDFSAVIG